MRVAFISFMWRERFIEEIGIHYLKKILDDADYSVQIFHKFPSTSIDDFAKEVLDYNPDFIGFSLSHKYTGINIVAKLSEIFKSKINGIHISVGGVFATFNAENILNESKYIDTVMLGESENTIIEFLQKIENKSSLDKIDGLAYRDNENIVINEKTKLIMDLDTIKFPDRSYIDKYVSKNILKAANIVGSRGCHGRCHFCNVPSMYSLYGNSDRWRGRSIKNIVDEIEYLYKEHKIIIFNFGDSSLEDNNPMSEGKSRLRELANEIIKRNLKIFYSCCFRAETFKDTPEDNELIELLVTSGLYNVLIGVEAGNKRALNDFSKRATVDDNYEAVKFFSKFPIYISKGFMMFTPSSDYEALKNNLEFARKINLTEEFIYLTTITSVFDGTPFVTDLQNEGLLDKDYDWRLEYPFKWKYINTGILANKMLEIRSEYMDELEYSQYYGRQNIILKRMKDSSLDNIFAYRDYKVKYLRNKISEIIYEFFNNCLNLLQDDWNESKYYELKNHYVDNKFLEVIDEMKLETRKFNRLLRQHNTSSEEIIENYVNNLSIEKTFS